MPQNQPVFRSGEPNKPLNRDPAAIEPIRATRRRIFKVIFVLFAGNASPRRSISSKNYSTLADFSRSTLHSR